MPPPPPTSAAAGDVSEQPTLRVMRLYKPRLDARTVLPGCDTAVASGIQGNARAAPAASGVVEGGGGGQRGVELAESEPLGGAGEGDFALSSALKLPDSFGNIYLGETFTAYIRYGLCSCGRPVGVLRMVQILQRT